MAQQDRAFAFGVTEHCFYSHLTFAADRADANDSIGLPIETKGMKQQRRCCTRPLAVETDTVGISVLLWHWTD